MPAKTNTEQIRLLTVEVATLHERVSGIRGEVDKLASHHQRMADSLAGLLARVAVVEQQVGDLRKTGEEGSRRWWSLWPALIGAMIGSILTFMGNLLLQRLRE